MRGNSTRGVLWQVLAPVIRWPLYSPARLATLVLLLAAALVLVGQLSAAPTAPRAAAPPAAQARASAPTAHSSVEPAAGPTEEPTEPASPPAPAPERTATSESSSPEPAAAADPPVRVLIRSANATQPTRVARGFVRAWARPSADPQNWQASVTAYTTARLGQALASTDPSQVPASQVAGVSLRDRTARSAVVVVGTDDGAVQVDLTRRGHRWRVANIARADQPPAAPTPDTARQS